jgi:hypothetical protein
VIAAQKDLTAGEIPDVLQVCLALGQVFSPAVISDQDKGVLRTDHLRAVSAKLFLMVFPDPAVELSGRLELGLKMQVKITDRIQAHAYLCCFCLFLSAFAMSIIFQGKFASIRRLKEDVSEVRAGFECGIVASGFNSFAEGDIIECFEIQKIQPSL